MKLKHKLALGGSIVAISALAGVKAQAMSVQDLADAATPVANEYGLYPSVMIAQGILESSNGQSTLATQYNNIFGVKYTSGTPVNMMTKEFLDGQMQDVVQPFQVYSSLTEACVAQASLIRGNSLYSGAWRENTTSYVDATAWLEGRYATDPSYASKLNAIIAEYGLTAYDGAGYATPVATAATETTATTGYTATAGQTYTIKEGDSLTAIAAAYDTTVENLMAINSLSDANSIVVGESITISTGASQVATTDTSGQATVATSSYTVQPGDTLTAVAAAYGTTPSAIMAMNGISDANSIMPGQTLNV
ncbi:LysM peptidoglycan-binding domain-containing protein [Lactococcus termiticola]|uniref:Peptidoglycan hydrolase n=1 Tax=Lactococcus termiticola TaxID=2169526 RepID=A0A2R5HHH6_9LACT|nr:LysM peptidoglycan-binding domain-containing protein [Lactococcus termiticola]GBG97432.1 N-acetylmuramidase [Lactococcus termiticola]